MSYIPAISHAPVLSRTAAKPRAVSDITHTLRRLTTSKEKQGSHKRCVPNSAVLTDVGGGTCEGGGWLWLGGKERQANLIRCLAILVTEDAGDMANQGWRAEKNLLDLGDVEKGPTWLGRSPSKFLSTPCLFI